MSIFRYEINKILEQEKERIFLWFPVIFAAGILFYFSLRFEPSIWWSLAVIETLIVLAYLWRQRTRALMVLSWIVVMVLGFINIQVRAYHINHIPLLQHEKTLYVKGYVDASGYNYRGKPYLILDQMQDFDDHSIQGKYRITLLNGKNNISVGDCVETVVNVRPLMSPSISYGYQFNRQQYFQGLKATGYTDVSVHSINCQDIGVQQGSFFPFIERLRNRIVQRIYQILPKNTAGIAAAIIAGERGRINSEQTQAYRDAGLAHFLAISGLHMGMIAGLTFLLVRWIAAWFPSLALKYNTKKIAAVLAIIMSFVYLLISGWQISAQRAFIMTFMVLVGVLCNRQAISMRMVAWAALIMLIIEPQILISAGFQMSFAAVIMLIAFYEKYAKFFQVKTEKHFITRCFYVVGIYLLGIVVADFIASMATLPFVIYHFNRISVYTSLANLLAGPIIGLWIMPCVLVVLISIPFGLEKYPLQFVGKGIDLLNEIADMVAHMDHASLQILSMPNWGLFLIVCGGLWLAIWQTKWRHWGWFLISIGYLSILTVEKPDVMTDELAKTFAVKDNSNQMVILPNRGNYFTKQMWYEKLAQVSATEKNKQKIQEIYQGQKTDEQFLSLVCDEDKCVYQKNIVLHKQGGIEINGVDYSDKGALMIYNVKKHPKIFIIKSIFGNRYWNNM